MGCCQSKQRWTASELLKTSKNLIQSGNLQTVQQIFSCFQKKNPDFDLNSLKISINNSLTVSILGFSLIFGQKEIFVYLHSIGASFSQSEDLFAESGTSGLSIICSNNYTSFLESYLPLFLSHKRRTPSRINLKSTLILDQAVQPHESVACSYTPVQLACEKGHISIVNYLKSYFSGYNLIPSEVDVHYVDPVTGNNCALIACQQNNFLMIKFLHSQCSADFSVVNSFSENALNVLSVGSQKCKVETFTCLQYLVEKVGVDPLFNWQETLILMQEDKSVKYLEELLEKLGVRVKKDELLNDQESFSQTKTVCNNIENRFTFTRLFPELAQDTSWISERLRVPQDE